MTVKNWTYCLLLSIFMTQSIIAATIQVGPLRTVTSPSAAAAIANDGDLIEIDAGNYSSTAITTWTQDNLTIRGVGGRPMMNVTGISIPNRKAIWVIQGNNTKVENIEFTGAVVPDHNGAGIRQEGEHLTVRFCYFHHNENAILESNKPDSEITVEYCELAYHGYGDGYSHNIYIGRCRKFIFRYNYSHHSLTGHLVKTRADENHIMYNRITDESDGQSSYLLDIPEGGLSYVIGNLFHEGAQSPNSSSLSYARENRNNPIQQLFVVNNTFVSDRANSANAIPINVGGTPEVTIVNNIFDNYGTVIRGEHTGSVTHNLSGTNIGFVNRAAGDYQLESGSSAINQGMNPGSGSGMALTPVEEYVHPRNVRTRNTVGELDIGAYEYREGDNQPPVLEPIGNQTLQAGQSIQFSIQASDPDPESVLDYSAAGTN